MGNGYKAYVFGESIRRYVIDHKGQWRKEVIYPCVADISYMQGVCKVYIRARGSPIEAPVVGFRNTTPPPIKAEL